MFQTSDQVDVAGICSMLPLSDPTLGPLLATSLAGVKASYDAAIALVNALPSTAIMACDQRSLDITALLQHLNDSGVLEPILQVGQQIPFLHL